jgi:2,3-dihydro-2,3-dihydroxybenzoate dehydrogenase
MKDKLAVVTGAAQGIGAAVVRALVSRGVRVAALDIQIDLLQKLAAQQDGYVKAYGVDLRSSQSVNAVVETIERDMGPIDMLVNVAGILRMASVVDVSDEDWDNTFAVNTHGVFYLSRAVARCMLPRKRGAIVTVGSNAAAVPRMQMAAYAASKAAACHFTKCLGLELAGSGIRCNGFHRHSHATAAMAV